MTVENGVDFRVTLGKALINKWRAEKDKSLVFADTEKMFGMIKSSLLLLLNIVNILIRWLNIQRL